MRMAEVSRANALAGLDGKSIRNWSSTSTFSIIRSGGGTSRRSFGLPGAIIHGKDKLTFCVFGAGRIGKLHARNVAAHPQARVKYIVDPVSKAAPNWRSRLARGRRPIPHGAGRSRDRCRRGRLVDHTHVDLITPPAAWASRAVREGDRFDIKRATAASRPEEAIASRGIGLTAASITNRRSSGDPQGRGGRCRTGGHHQPRSRAAARWNTSRSPRLFGHDDP